LKKIYSKKNQSLKPKNKTVVLRSHHSKAYRKRYIGIFILSILLMILISVSAIQYKTQLTASFVSGRDFIEGLFNNSDNYDMKIHSTLGYDVTYNQDDFYASAIDAKSGNLFIGSQLTENRAYDVIRITSSSLDRKNSKSIFTITYHDNDDEIKPYTTKDSLESLRSIALKDNGIIESSLSNISSQSIKINGQDFLKTIWTSSKNNLLLSKISNKVITYVGIVDGKCVTIVVETGIGDVDDSDIYNGIISSIKFGKFEQLSVNHSSYVAANTTYNRTIFDTLMFSSIASAAPVNDISSSERVSALYSSAVVKIYNAYCMDILIDNSSFINNACNSLTGSGFIVTDDGYIATNGHVATANIKSLAIENALTLYSKGDDTYVKYLLDISGVTESDIPNGSSDDEAAAILIDKFYDIPDSRITVNNDVNNLLVCLTEKQPDVTQLLKSTEERDEYPGQNTIKRAKLIASDYLALDGIDGYRASDVAIIKISGSNYPIVKLGTIDDVNQGSDLIILGYPGIATDNGIVESTVSKVSLTVGKVSSKKKASGSNNMLIETDSTIGHGNSGGPALSSKGTVVGVVTYTVDGSGQGDGAFNYIRDIKDLVDLSDKSSLKIDGDSATQDEWESGINNYYSSHLSKAVENFNKVNELYPYHSKADEFIKSANQRIENGEDIKDFPIVFVSVISTLPLITALAMSFMIVRHKRRHNIYKEKLISGEAKPFEPNLKSQKITLEINPSTLPNNQVK